MTTTDKLLTIIVFILTAISIKIGGLLDVGSINGLVGSMLTGVSIVLMLILLLGIKENLTK